MTSTHRILPFVVAMAAVVAASNFLVQYPFAHFGLGEILTWGAFTYPVAFLVNDLTNRRFGPRAARKVVLAGFVIAVVLSVWLATPRIAFASGTAFLAAQLLDASIFDRLREGNWWKAPLASTLVGSSLDTAIFFFIAFSQALVFIEPGNDVSWANEALPLLGAGPMVPLWVSLAVADWLVKLSLALIALIPFRAIVSKLSPDLA